jgi:hypothetical protein
MFEDTAEPLTDEAICQEVCAIMGIPQVSHETAKLIWRKWQLNVGQPYDSRDAATTPNVVQMIRGE